MNIIEFPVEAILAALRRVSFHGETVHRIDRDNGFWTAYNANGTPLKNFDDNDAWSLAECFFLHRRSISVS